MRTARASRACCPGLAPQTPGLWPAAPWAVASSHISGLDRDLGVSFGLAPSFHRWDTWRMVTDLRIHGHCRLNGTSNLRVSGLGLSSPSLPPQFPADSECFPLHVQISGLPRSFSRAQLQTGTASGGPGLSPCVLLVNSGNTFTHSLGRKGQAWVFLAEVGGRAFASRWSQALAAASCSPLSPQP